MNSHIESLLGKYLMTRQYSESICAPLSEGDYQLQAMEDVSPAKWHLAHTTWFFETFILKKFIPAYQPFNPQWSFMYNSYYEHEGQRIQRAKRGDMSRPFVQEIYDYRADIDEKIKGLFSTFSHHPEFNALIELGCQHEQQHQELLYTDIQYNLSVNPMGPVYKSALLNTKLPSQKEWISIPEGIYTIGHQGTDFCFDNELGVHRHFLESFQISKEVLSVGEYLEFMEDGGYERFEFWLSEGWNWVKNNGVKAPLYWIPDGNNWLVFTLGGIIPLDTEIPVAHLNYYEADAYTRWKGCRLPTEFEWEVAHSQLNYGKVWEWTQSAYLPYPGFKTASGALGEYNGKWMINQMVLRGGSVATPKGHFRPTYRNFFHPDKSWQFSGLRLAK